MLALLFGVFFSLNVISATVVVKSTAKKEEDIKRTVPKVSAEPKIYAIPTDGKHKVKEGETLFAIANMYGISYKTILKLNNLKDADYVIVGQKLQIIENKVDAPKDNIEKKDKKLSSDKQNAKQNTEVMAKDFKKSDVKNRNEEKPELSNQHTVKEGETLFAIARMYNINPTLLASENNLDLLYHVKTGEKIKIPQNVINKTEDKKDEKNTPKKDLDDDKQVISHKTRDKIDKNKIDCDLKFSWPVNSKKILYGYGDILHNGVKSDGVIIASGENKNIVASYTGEVAYVGNDIPEYGNLMIVKHADNWMTIYGYMNSFSKKVGDKVKKGDSLGTVGQTGKANIPSLYFSIRKIKIPYNPELCI